MAAFDRLPAAVRRRLAESPFDFSPVRLAEDRQTFGLDAAATVAFIEELEAWGRAELARAKGVDDGNRLDAATEPDVEAMVERVLTRHVECRGSRPPAR